jgi:hypothetical protein
LVSMKIRLEKKNVFKRSCLCFLFLLWLVSPVCQLIKKKLRLLIQYPDGK